MVAILEAVTNQILTPTQLAKALRQMTPEQLKKVSAKIAPETIGRLLSARRQAHRGGRKPVMKTCPHCTKEMSSRAYWVHEPSCYRKHHPKEGSRAGRPEGWRKGDGSYAGFTPPAA